MHLHFGLLHFAGVFGGVLLIGTFWRLLAAKLADAGSWLRNVGEAMAFMY